MINDNAHRRAIHSHSTYLLTFDVHKILLRKNFFEFFGIEQPGFAQGSFVQWLFSCCYKSNLHTDISASTWSTNKAIQNELGFDVKRIERLLKSLADHKIIIRKRANGKRYIAFSNEAIEYLRSRCNERAIKGNRDNLPPALSSGLEPKPNLPPVLSAGLVDRVNPSSARVVNPSSARVGSIYRRNLKENLNSQEMERGEPVDNCKFELLKERFRDKIPDSLSLSHKGMNQVDFCRKYVDPYTGGIGRVKERRFEAQNKLIKRLLNMFGMKTLINGFEALEAEYRIQGLPALFENYSFDDICFESIRIALQNDANHNQN